MVYVSGAITPTAEFPSIEENSRRFYDKTFELFMEGFSVYCPRQAWMDDHPIYGKVLTTDKYGDLYEKILAMDMEIIRRVDALYMMRGWEHSKGAKREHDYALSLSLPVSYE